MLIGPWLACGFASNVFANIVMKSSAAPHSLTIVPRLASAETSDSVQSFVQSVDNTELLRYSFTKEEVKALRKLRTQLQKKELDEANLAWNNSLASSTVGSRTSNLLQKRELRDDSILTCTKHNKYEGHVLVERWDWRSAQCMDPYEGVFFRVWCSGARRHPTVPRSWVYMAGTSNFVDECLPHEECRDWVRRSHSNGEQNSIHCFSEDPDSDDDEEDVDMIQESSDSEMESCRSMVITNRGTRGKRIRPGWSPNHPVQRRRVYSLQEEVTLLNGGDYKAARLFFKDMNMPYYMQSAEIASRVNANVTNHEIIIDPNIGVQSRSFQYCARLPKSGNGKLGERVLLHYSHSTIDREAHQRQAQENIGER